MKIITQIFLLVAGCSCVSAASSYAWQNWSSSSPGGLDTIRASSVSSSGTAILTVSGPATQISNRPVQFVSDVVTSPSTEIINFSDSSDNWSFHLELFNYTTSQGVIVGIGNIRQNTNYQLTAFGPLGVPISLTSLSVIGNYDYHWNSLTGPLFNDDLSLNLATGNFGVSTVAGGFPRESDMLLLELPDGVEILRVATISPTYGDAINVMIGSVPEPSSALLGGFGCIAAVFRRKR